MSDNHGWANPSPAGLVALAMACFTFFALLTGKVEHTAIPLLGCWLIGGFVVQLIVGLIELREGNSTGGNVFAFFAAFFMLVGGLEFMVKYFAAIHGWPLDARIDGWAWLTLAIALITWTPAYFKAPLFLCLAVVCLDVAVPIICLMDLQVLAPTAAPIAGYFLAVTAILGLYIAAAIITNTAYNRQVIPMPGPIVK
jgi:succinate-acetate transporter protein